WVERTGTLATDAEVVSDPSATGLLAPAESEDAPGTGASNDVPPDSLLDLVDPEVSPRADAALLPGESDSESRAPASAISKYRPRLRPRTAPPSRPAPVRKEQEQAAGTFEAFLLLTFLPG